MRLLRAIVIACIGSSLPALAGCAIAAQQMPQRCEGPPAVTVRNGLPAAVEVYAQVPGAGNQLLGVVEANSMNTFDGVEGAGVTYAIRYQVAARQAALTREQSERVRLTLSCR